MSDEWQDIPEDDGLTLGPEEALAREIAKSKALKVERLRLKDQVDQLTARNKDLLCEIEALHHNQPAGPASPHAEKTGLPGQSARPRNPFLPNRWAFFLLVFNLAAIGILLLFMLQQPAPDEPDTKPQTNHPLPGEGTG